MAHRFEITKDVEVGATPEEVWEAIATGPGMDSWFMGQSEVEPREGGRARWSIGGYTEDSTVTTWDPPKRFVFSWELSCSQDLRDAKVEVIFTGVPDGTEVKLVHTGWEHKGEAAIPMRDRFNAGWATVFEKCYVEYANARA